MKFHDELNQALFDGMELKPEVKDKLKEIADAFIEYLEIDRDAIKDVRLYGSSVSYNYTKYSDLDLHLVVDYDKIHEDCPIVEGYLWAFKAEFNKNHNISIYGVPVEVYAEKTGTELISNGIYSLTEDKWLKEPEKIEPTDNDAAVEAKFNELKEAIDRCDDSEVAEELQNKIYEMRKAGLDEVGEFSTENLAFKALRNAGCLDKLKQLKKENVDKQLSLESFEEAMEFNKGDLVYHPRYSIGVVLEKLDDLLVKVEFCDGEKIVNKNVITKYDDSYKNELKYCTPILRKYGYTNLLLEDCDNCYVIEFNYEDNYNQGIARGQIKVKANSEEEALQKAEDSIRRNPTYAGKGVNNFRIVPKEYAYSNTDIIESLIESMDKALEEKPIKRAVKFFNWGNVKTAKEILIRDCDCTEKQAEEILVQWNNDAVAQAGANRMKEELNREYFVGNNNGEMVEEAGVFNTWDEASAWIDNYCLENNITDYMDCPLMVVEGDPMEELEEDCATLEKKLDDVQSDLDDMIKAYSYNEIDEELVLQNLKKSIQEALA